MYYIGYVLYGFSAFKKYLEASRLPTPLRVGAPLPSRCHERRSLHSKQTLVNNIYSKQALISNI